MAVSVFSDQAVRRHDAYQYPFGIRTGPRRGRCGHLGLILRPGRGSPFGVAVGDGGGGGGSGDDGGDGGGLFVVLLSVIISLP